MVARLPAAGALDEGALARVLRELQVAMEEEAALEAAFDAAVAEEEAQREITVAAHATAHALRVAADAADAKEKELREKAVAARAALQKLERATKSDSTIMI